MSNPAVIEKKEQLKYEKAYGHEEYKTVECVIVQARQAIDELQIPQTASIIDFGCGSGAASGFFSDEGYKITAIDIASNCLLKDLEGKFPFLVGCLWDLPKSLKKADYGFCADVMEHIPPEYVEKVLAEIARVTRKGVFFQICFRIDHWGDKIGERLHLTVQPPAWWEAKLREYWPYVEPKYINPEGGGIFVCSNALLTPAVIAAASVPSASNAQATISFLSGLKQKIRHRIVSSRHLSVLYTPLRVVAHPVHYSKRFIDKIKQRFISNP